MRPETRVVALGPEALQPARPRRTGRGAWANLRAAAQTPLLRPPRSCIMSILNLPHVYAIGTGERRRRMWGPKLGAALALLALAEFTLGSGARAQTIVASEVFKKAGEISFCSELADPPAAYLAADGTTPDGFEVDIMSAIGRALGVRADIRNYKFAAIFAALDSGKCDAVMSQTSKSPERLQKYLFVDIRQQGSGLLVKAGNPLNLQTYLDLSGRRVAVLLGSANERRLQEANTKLAAENKAPMAIASYATNVAAFQELDLGRVDAFVSGSLTLAFFLNKSGAKFVIGGMPVPPTTLGALFPKDQGEKAEAVKAVYASLVANGEIKKIVDKWGVGQGTSICGGGFTCD
ncbi:MAG: ABC transporter substrate-binding protein [Proteobacteria bacterium]|nr:ABC transporter substrate-binding protein [Pseudomonadota bacterium]